MKLRTRSLVLSIISSAAILLICVGLLLRYQSVRIEKQIAIAEESVRKMTGKQAGLSSPQDELVIRTMSDRLRMGARKNFHLVAASAGIGILVSGFVVYLVVLSITRRLERMVAVAEKIRKGDYAARLGETGWRDELGDLASTMDDMTSAIRTRDEALRTSADRLWTVIDAMPAGVMIVDTLSRKITEVNPAAAKMIGVSRDDMVGMDCCTFFCRAVGKRCPVLDDGKPLDGKEIDLDRPGGTLTILKSVVSVDIGGRPHLLESMIDISRLKEAERENERLGGIVAQSQKMEAIGALAGGIAHDFNNILMPIIGYSEMALQRLPEGDPARGDIRQVTAAATRARDLVRQILDFSRQSPETCFPLSLHPLIKEAVKLVRSSIPRTIEFRQKIDPECGSVKADPARIQQILLNLLSNASQAIGEQPGTIRISLEPVVVGPADRIGSPPLPPGRYARLTVSDTGSGMAPETARRIFEPFFTTKEPGKGTGLGLSVVLGIVHSFDGAITVESEPGEGSTFRVLLPLLEQAPLPDGEAGDPAALPRGSGERILVVDDEQDVGLVAGEILRSLGYEVAIAGSGDEALRTFRSAPRSFDLLLTDRTMPGIQGDELIRRVREIRPELPVILASGFWKENGEDASRIGPPSGILTKPVTSVELAEEVRRTLDDGAPAPR